MIHVREHKLHFRGIQVERIRPMSSNGIVSPCRRPRHKTKILPPVDLLIHCGSNASSCNSVDAMCTDTKSCSGAATDVDTFCGDNANDTNDSDCNADNDNKDNNKDNNDNTDMAVVCSESDQDACLSNNEISCQYDTPVQQSRLQIYGLLDAVVARRKNIRQAARTLRKATSERLMLIPRVVVQAIDTSVTTDEFDAATQIVSCLVQGYVKSSTGKGGNRKHCLHTDNGARGPLACTPRATHGMFNVVCRNMRTMGCKMISVCVGENVTNQLTRFNNVELRALLLATVAHSIAWQSCTLGHVGSCVSGIVYWGTTVHSCYWRETLFRTVETCNIHNLSIKTCIAVPCAKDFVVFNNIDTQEKYVSVFASVLKWAMTVFASVVDLSPSRLRWLFRSVLGVVGMRFDALENAAAFSCALSAFFNCEGNIMPGIKRGALDEVLDVIDMIKSGVVRTTFCCDNMIQAAYADAKSAFDFNGGAAAMSSEHVPIGSSRNLMELMGHLATDKHVCVHHRGIIATVDSFFASLSPLEPVVGSRTRDRERRKGLSDRQCAVPFVVHRNAPAVDGNYADAERDVRNLDKVQTSNLYQSWQHLLQRNDEHVGTVFLPSLLTEQAEMVLDAVVHLERYHRHGELFYSAAAFPATNAGDCV